MIIPGSFLFESIPIELFLQPYPQNFDPRVSDHVCVLECANSFMHSRAQAVRRVRSMRTVAHGSAEGERVVAISSGTPIASHRVSRQQQR
jgi:hypothetical protein